MPLILKQYAFNLLGQLYYLWAVIRVYFQHFEQIKDRFLE